MNTDEERVEEPQPLAIGGTWVWYYAICHRELWLMAHAITPDEDDENLQYGRFMHDRAYQREGEEVSVGASKMDRVIEVQGKVVVVEIKKSSRAIESARLQLANYLVELENRGIVAQGELRFPDERRRESLVLDDSWRHRVEEAHHHIAQIVAAHTPPPVKHVAWCGHCAYRDLCWA
ncbi:MAG: CRISPR-associated protein Cas4 [Sulfobacillus thermotolerans]|uniref:CRISPR-associated exonuclease Cas4 n=1 Tax=Sulfobacillus thermotolerans TaxID=338644 RepID=A0ABN5H0Z3_9FIRM|nr:CRISPR-associated protein Cas4 [Sulfobacillus thermotolerans]MCY0910007.1 CRISPR-associated protein Cas4 [Sulfobacillus thermotolerans]